MLDSLWTRLVEALSQKLPAAILDNWVRPCRLLAIEGDHLKIGAPNKFSRDWLMQHHLEALQQGAQDVIGGQPRISIVIDDDPVAVTVARTSAPAPAPAAPPRAGGTTEGLNPRYTFDAFVVGSSNQFAQAACQAVAELPSKAYNPLFIYGGVGLGKTHLLHAVGHQSAKLFPGMTVVYLSDRKSTRLNSSH